MRARQGHVKAVWRGAVQVCDDCVQMFGLVRSPSRLPDAAEDVPFESLLPFVTVPEIQGQEEL